MAKDGSLRALRLLHCREDRRSVAAVMLALALLGLPHVTAPAGLAAAVWISSALLACFVANIVSHNHMHRPVFRGHTPNMLFNVGLSLARGHSASGIIVPHHMNHHPLAGADGDWIGPSLAGHGLGWVRLVRYVARASVNMAVQRARADAPRLPPRLQRRLWLEKGLLALVILALAALDWRVFLLFDALPWFGGLVLLVGVNLLQHDACEPQRPLGESRNFTGTFGNWLFFNNGYHTAHHLEPQRHWSELPAAHAALRERLPHPSLEHPSILVFLWRFGWARDGVRVETRP